VVPGENGIEGTRGGMNMDATRGTPRPMWFLTGLSKTEKQRLQKLCRSELQKEEERERDEWFNRARPMIKRKHTWREKN
jgi:hypothetical protein